MTEKFQVFQKKLFPLKFDKLVFNIIIEALPSTLYVINLENVAQRQLAPMVFDVDVENCKQAIHMQCE